MWQILRMHLESDSLHLPVMNNDMMSMQELTHGVVIEAGQTVKFEPAGKHIMLMGLMQQLVADQTFDITLTFADGSTKTVEFTVRDASGKQMPQHNHH